jgi:hypothetical protein
MGTDKFNGIKQMSYEQAKSKIKTGDLLFCSGRYLVSEMIKRMSNSAFSHIAVLVFWDEHVLVLESVEDDGIRVVPLTHYLFNYENSKEKYNGEMYVARHKVVDGPDFDKEKIKAMCGKVIDLLNRNYDKDEIAKIFARISLGMGRHSDDFEYMCSEFVDECFKELGIELLRDPMGFIFPEHIAADPNVKPLFEMYP